MGRSIGMASNGVHSFVAPLPLHLLHLTIVPICSAHTNAQPAWLRVCVMASSPETAHRFIYVSTLAYSWKASNSDYPQGRMTVLEEAPSYRLKLCILLRPAPCGTP